VLINYLVKHKAEMGDGGKFKKAMFTRALRAIKPHHSAAPPQEKNSLNMHVKISIGEFGYTIGGDKKLIDLLD
jgi:hypothetical protein